MQILLRMHDVRSQLKRLHKSLSSLISYRMILATMLQENIQIREAGNQARTQELRKTWKKINALSTTPKNISMAVFLDNTWSIVATHSLLETPDRTSHNHTESSV